MRFLNVPISQSSVSFCQVSAALSVAKSTRMEDFQELRKTDSVHWFDIRVNSGST